MSRSKLKQQRDKFMEIITEAKIRRLQNYPDNENKKTESKLVNEKEYDEQLLHPVLRDKVNSKQ